MPQFKTLILEVVSTYKQILRKNMAQADRVKKLSELKLRALSHDSDYSLYEAAYRILHDIDSNMSPSGTGYYAYCGVESFAKHLRQTLAAYSVESNRVVHRAQEASRALLDSIQLISLPDAHLTPKKMQSIRTNSRTIAKYGSQEQCVLYRENLEKFYRERGAFHGPMLNFFDQQIEELRKE